MNPADIKKAREALGLSVREFELAIGYDADGRITQALEAGTRNGKAFIMTGSALKALQYLIALKDAYEAIGKWEDGQPYYAIKAEEILRKALPRELI